MRINTPHNLRNHHQNGYATLLVVLILLVGMTTLSLTVSRSSIIEQQLSSNDSRAQETHLAAEAGLDYAIAFAAIKTTPWLKETLTCGNETGCPAPLILTGNDGGTFDLSIHYTHKPLLANTLNIVVNATQADNNSKAQLSVSLLRNPLTLAVTQIPGTWKDF